MATAFTRTLRSLEADRFRRLGTGIGVALIMLGAWGFWSVRSRIPLYETSSTARLEIDNEIYPVQSPLLGRVVSTSLVNGREVKSGDVLVELDAGPEELQLHEQQTRFDAIAPELHALEAQVLAQKRAESEEHSATQIAIEEAQSRGREADAPAGYAKTDARRMNDLKSEGLISQRDFERGASEANRLQAAADSAHITAKRLAQEQQARDSERAVLLERIASDRARLEGERGTLEASLHRLSYELERRRIRAPVAGRVAESTSLKVGGVVAEGERLGAILPSGHLRVVSQFPPPAALGRIREGQEALLRLRGFPWAEYGAVRARVSNVADEVRDGSIRVELSVEDSPGLRVPLRHGMPGDLEVEVERVSPAALLLRTAGQALVSPRNSGAR